MCITDDGTTKEKSNVHKSTKFLRQKVLVEEPLTRYGREAKIRKTRIKIKGPQILFVDD